MAEVLYSQNKPPLSIEETESLFTKNQDKLDLIRQSSHTSEQRWDYEIALLQRRVAEQFEEVDIGKGDMFAIRTCLSDEESEEFARLLTASENEKTLKDRADALYDLLALITANPKLTADFFRNNRSQYATMDAMGILVGFLESKVEQLKERKERVEILKSFRPK